MDEENFRLAETLVSPAYIHAGAEAHATLSRVLRVLLSQRRCPEDGLHDVAIQQILYQLSLMDTNNFPFHAGGGEREGRVWSALVRQRHYGLAHGVGRSGDLTSEQPKAAGSTLLYQLTNCMVLDALRMAGAGSTAAALVVPMATGMTLALAFRCLVDIRAREAKEKQEKNKTKEDHHTLVKPRYVIWPRIDQKTCLKCIVTAGLVPYLVELQRLPLSCHASPSPTEKEETNNNHKNDDNNNSQAYCLQCSPSAIEAAIDSLGEENVVCVFSTTSCFAPRVPDDVVRIAQLCHRRGLPHLINNAYGVQSRFIMNKIDAAQRLGRVDFVVQSSDKNFLVPVGGAVLSSPMAPRVKEAAALYAGRASASPVVDLFITLLGLGRHGLQNLWAAREECRWALLCALRKFAEERHEEVICDDAVERNAPIEGRDASPSTTPLATANAEEKITEESTRNVKREKKKPRGPPLRNDISFGVTMRHCKDVEKIGGKLFRSSITGPRVVMPQPPPPPPPSSLGTNQNHDHNKVEEKTSLSSSSSSAVKIAGCVFRNYGMHEEQTPPCPLLIVACGIGMTREEVKRLMAKLEVLWPLEK